MHFKHICLITWYLTQANNKKTSRISVLISLNQLNCLKQIKSIRYMIELLFRRSFHIKIKDMVRTRCVMLVKCWLQADRHYMKTHVKMRPFTPFNSCNWTNTLFTSIIFQIIRGRTLEKAILICHHQSTRLKMFLKWWWFYEAKFIFTIT